MLHHLYLVELHIDVLRVLEDTGEVRDILLLRLLDIYHLIIIERHAGEVAVGFLLHHLTCNDQCLIREHTVQQVDILTVIRCSEVLHEIHNDLSARIIEVTLLLSHDLLIALQVDRDAYTRYESAGSEVNRQLLTRLLLVGLDHIHGNTAHLIAGGRLQTTTHNAHRRTAHRTGLPHQLHILDGLGCEVVLRQFEFLLLLIGSRLK